MTKRNKLFFEFLMLQWKIIGTVNIHIHSIPKLGCSNHLLRGETYFGHNIFRNVGLDLDIASFDEEQGEWRLEATCVN